MIEDKVARPTEIRLNQTKDQLHLIYADGNTLTFTAEFLRVHSPSAEVQGHGPSERKIIGGKRRVMISTIEPVGHYAIRILFGDGHSTGIFSWDYLQEIGSDHEKLWSQYLRDLEQRGLSRD